MYTRTGSLEQILHNNIIVSQALTALGLSLDVQVNTRQDQSPGTAVWSEISACPGPESECLVCPAHRVFRPQSSSDVNAVCSPLWEAASVPATAHHHAVRRPAQHVQQTGDTPTHAVQHWLLSLMIIRLQASCMRLEMVWITPSYTDNDTHRFWHVQTVQLGSNTDTH